MCDVLYHLLWDTPFNIISYDIHLWLNTINNGMQDKMALVVIILKITSSLEDENTQKTQIIIVCTVVCNFSSVKSKEFKMWV